MAEMELETLNERDSGNDDESEEKRPKPNEVENGANGNVLYQLDGTNVNTMPSNDNDEVFSKSFSN